MRRVIVESPFKNLTRTQATAYARDAMIDCIKRGEAPFVSHLLYTQILNDNEPEERALGLEMGLIWGERASATIVYTDYGISEGMQQGIDRAKAEGRSVEYRSLHHKVAEPPLEAVEKARHDPRWDAPQKKVRAVNGRIQRTPSASGLWEYLEGLARKGMDIPWVSWPDEPHRVRQPGTVGEEEVLYQRGDIALLRRRGKTGWAGLGTQAYFNTSYRVTRLSTGEEFAESEPKRAWVKAVNEGKALVETIAAHDTLAEEWHGNEASLQALRSAP